MDLILEQKQQQKLSPQMIQSMELLQMGAQELQERIDELLLENPMLERGEGESPEADAQLFRHLAWLAATDRQNRSYYRDDSPDPIERAADASGESLYQHLSAQIPWQELSPSLRRGVEGVLDALDENGRLEEPPAGLAVRCGVSRDVMLIALKLVQELEPAGVGACSLEQCLALQLVRRGETGLPLRIVKQHLEDMARSHYHRIAQQTGADRREIQAACALIRSLDPRPGAAFAPAERPAYTVPDLTVTVEEGEPVVRWVSEPFSALTLSPYYLDLLEQTDDPQVREYLADRLRQAQQIMENIDRRRDTVLRCARSIAARQRAFFTGEADAPVPLTLAEVAQDTGVHESTVSRAVRDKSLQCARGAFPLSRFFTRQLSAGAGEVSAAQAKARLAALIAGEDKSRPLSDQKLCLLLEQQGLTLSRRTAAKYREELGIPPASGRKEFT